MSILFRTSIHSPVECSGGCSLCQPAQPRQPASLSFAAALEQLLQRSSSSSHPETHPAFLETIDDPSGDISSYNEATPVIPRGPTATTDDTNTIIPFLFSNVINYIPEFLAPHRIFIVLCPVILHLWQ